MVASVLKGLSGAESVLNFICRPHTSEDKLTWHRLMSLD